MSQGFEMPKLMAMLFATLMAMGWSVPGWTDRTSQQEMRSLDEQVQEIKTDVLAIAAELNLLEERLLFPSNTQLAVFVSLSDTESFRLDAVQVLIDGELAAHHIYSFKELDALKSGGVQRIFVGNVTTGEHQIEVVTVQSASCLDATSGPRAEAIACIWEQPDLRLVLQANAAACRWRTPCLFVDLSHGQHATLGPFYIPGEGACYQCYRCRWRENTSTPAEFEAAESAMLNDGKVLPAYGILPAFRYQVVGMACAVAKARAFPRKRNRHSLRLR